MEFYSNFNFFELTEEADPLLWIILFLMAWIIRPKTFLRIQRVVRGRFAAFMRSYRLFGLTNLEKMELVSLLN